MSVLSTKNRLTSNSANGALRAILGAGVGVAAFGAVTAEAQSNFVSLPGAQFVVDQATGNARVTYQGQMYQVNVGHYNVGADGTLSISSEAASTVAPNAGNTVLNTANNVVSGTAGLAGDVVNTGVEATGGLIDGVSNVLLGGGVIGAVALGGLGFTAFQTFNSQDVTISKVGSVDVSSDNKGGDAESLTLTDSGNKATSFTLSDANWFESHTFTVKDEDGDTVSDFAVTGSAGTFGGDTSYTLTYSGTADVSNKKLTIGVTDNQGNTDDVDVTVSYTKSNDGDTTAPTLTITTDDSSLSKDDTATITFTFSETVTGFTKSDVTVTGGTIGDISGSGTTYTATLTPTADSTTDVKVSVASGAAKDGSDNNNTAAELSITTDTTKTNTGNVTLTESDLEMTEGTAAGELDVDGKITTSEIIASVTDDSDFFDVSFTDNIGTVTLTDAGAVEYGQGGVPNAGETDSFKITVTDNDGDETELDLTVTINDDNGGNGDDENVNTTTSVLETDLDETAIYRGGNGNSDTFTVTAVQNASIDLDGGETLEDYEVLNINYAADDFKVDMARIADVDKVEANGAAGQELTLRNIDRTVTVEGKAANIGELDLQTEDGDSEDVVLDLGETTNLVEQIALSGVDELKIMASSNSAAQVIELVDTSDNSFTGEIVIDSQGSGGVVIEDLSSKTSEINATTSTKNVTIGAADAAVDIESSSNDFDYEGGSGVDNVFLKVDAGNSVTVDLGANAETFLALSEDTGTLTNHDIDGGTGSDTVLVNTIIKDIASDNSYQNFEKVRFDHSEENAFADMDLFEGKFVNIEAIGGGNDLGIANLDHEAEITYINSHPIDAADNLYIGMKDVTDNSSVSVDFAAVDGNSAEFGTIDAAYTDSEFEGKFGLAANLLGAQDAAQTLEIEADGELTIAAIEMSTLSTLVSNVILDNDAAANAGELRVDKIEGNVGLVDASGSTGDIDVYVNHVSDAAGTYEFKYIGSQNASGSANPGGGDTLQVEDSNASKITFLDISTGNDNDVVKVVSKGAGTATGELTANSKIDTGVGDDVIDLEDAVNGTDGTAALDKTAPGDYSEWLEVDSGLGADSITLGTGAGERVVVNDISDTEKVTVSLDQNVAQEFNVRHDTIDNFDKTLDIVDFSDLIDAGTVFADTYDAATGFKDGTTDAATLDYDTDNAVIITQSTIKNIDELADEFNDVAVTNQTVNSEVLIIAELDGNDSFGLFHFVDKDGDGRMSDGDEVTLLADVTTVGNLAEIDFLV